MWELMLVFLGMALWQWSRLRQQSPTSRWTILADKGCLALPSVLSLVRGARRPGRVSIWLTEEEFIIVEGNQKRKWDVIDATVLDSVKRDAVEELILLFGEDALGAAKKLGFSDEEFDFHGLVPSNSLTMLIRCEESDGRKVSHAFCMDRSLAVVPIHEHVIGFFQRHAHAPIRITVQ